MNDIVVVSILFYISIKREFVCSLVFLPSLFSFLGVQKKKSITGDKERGERSFQIFAESLSLSLSLSRFVV